MTDSVHRGKGILPGDFIKPDPGSTQKEARDWILAELERWFTKTDLAAHALEISVIGLDVSRSEVDAGTWPAGRLNMIVGLVNENIKTYDPLDATFRFRRESYHGATTICLKLCVEALTMGVRGSDPISQLALGFIDTDLLPCGSTIGSFWDHTPTDPLRFAAPLSTGQESEVVVDEVVVDEVVESEVVVEDEVVSGSEADDESEDESGPVGIDERVDATLNDLLMREVVIKGPAWVYISVLLACVSYMWIVVFALSVARL